MLVSPSRQFRGRVEVFQGSTLTSICGCHDRLIDFKVERTGEANKLFGYGICQKLTTNFLDRDRTLFLDKTHSLEVEFGVESDYIYPFPIFHVEEVKRDENTNNITVVAYDSLYAAAAHKVAELSLPESYTIGQFAAACASLLGIPMKATDNPSFNTLYPNGANFEGSETIREALNAVAEATQTIYYIDNNWELTFKRLDITGEPVVTIDKEKYFTLNSKENIKLTSLIHATELGDDVIATTGEEGATQYIRNNPFWDLRADVDVLLSEALTAVKGLAANQFTCSWRGNYLIEIGDKIALTTKDDTIVVSYLLNDTMEFNGGLSSSSSWSYTENKSETPNNPSTLGETLKQTYARVDKQNKQIELLVSETGANKNAISSLQMNTENIAASVQEVQNQANSALDEIETLSKRVDAQITADDVSIQIQTELENGSKKVITATGYTFDEDGLTIEKTNREMKTKITEDGMTVYKNDNAVLTANNTGVDAVNLHATTYLIIGNNSRLEDYGSGRTGCFWIGG